MKLMIIFLLPLMLLTSLLKADIKQNLFELYKHKQYKEACDLGFVEHKDFIRDEEFISLYAFSCLKVDYIDRIALPSTLLKMSSEARSNAAYFSIILMQKKLLYHSLIDNYNLSKFKFPTTDYVLSKVFDKYSLLKQNNQDFYIFKDDDNKHITYKLFLSKDYKIIKMVIEEYYDTIMTKRHEYW